MYNTWISISIIYQHSYSKYQSTCICRYIWAEKTLKIMIFPWAMRDLTIIGHLSCNPFALEILTTILSIRINERRDRYPSSDICASLRKTNRDEISDVSPWHAAGNVGKHQFMKSRNDVRWSSKTCISALCPPCLFQFVLLCVWMNRFPLFVTFVRLFLFLENEGNL